MICNKCQHDNKIQVPFCDRCGASLYRETRRFQALAKAAQEKPPKPPPAVLIQGRPIGQTSQGESILALLSQNAKPTQAQCEYFARRFKMDAYEARLSLHRPLPQIVAFGPDDLVFGLAEELVQAGLSVFCGSAEAIFAPLQGWTPHQLTLDSTSISSHGPQGSTNLDLTQRCLLLRGRYEYNSAPTRSPSGTSKRNTTRSLKSLNAQQADWIDFLHIYQEHNPYPIIIRSDYLKDYNFLGPRMTPSASTNFQLLANQLAAFSHVCRDESLLKYSGTLQENLATRQTLPLLRRRIEAGETRSNEAAANLISRMKYELFCAVPQQA